MADSATKGQGIEREDGVEPAITMNPDGSAVVDFSGPKPDAPVQIPFGDNLTPMFSNDRLSQLGNEIWQYADEDERSRADWRKTYTRGLNLLGLKYEERTDPWEGACGAFHPMLLESVIRFNAQAMMDLFPGAGPAKTQIIGDISDEVERQALRVRRDLNWLATRKIKGYRLETDMMLFNLPLAGTTFRKFGYDEERQVPWAEYVLPEHVLMPYSAASLDTSPRFTIIMPKSKNWIASRIKKGKFRDVTLTAPVVFTSDVQKEKDKIEGKSNANQPQDNLYRLLECHIDYYFDEDAEMNPASLPRPYVITIEKDSRQVLSIRRNWKQNDPAYERQVNVVQHKYMPGFGPYGIGLINILGGLTESATSILRQLVDAGTLANLPAGYKTKNARIKDDSAPIGPGEWRDVEVGMGTLKESFFPLPYGEPSTVLAALLGQIVDEGRRIGSVADMKITDMTGQNMPVGTTLAIIERSMKVMSAVQQRLYESFTQELIVISEIVRDFMSELPYPFRLKQIEQGSTRKEDYDDRVDIIPVADPNASTMAQRIMVMQAIIQLSAQAPQIYNLKNVHRDMITVLGSDKADAYIPPDEQVLPADPVTENMNILIGKPVKVGPEQDHAAHITVHMTAAQDPMITTMLTNNPAAPGIMAAANAHILEHLGFKYRKDIEEQLGFPLPPPGSPLPDDVEMHLSQLMAQGAQKLLAKDKAEEEQKKILDALQDPVIQNQSREVAVKEMNAETQRMKTVAMIEGDSARRLQDTLLAIFREMSATERATLVAEIQSKTDANELQLREAELAADLGQGVMGKVADLLIARYNGDTRAAMQRDKGKAA